MSAYVLDRCHFVTIAKFIARRADAGPTGSAWMHVFHPEALALRGAHDYYITAIEAANALLIGNLESVSHRYSEQLETVSVITAKDLSADRGKFPDATDMFGILRSLKYQSCERDDYPASLAHAVLIEVLWLAGKVAAEHAGAEAWA